MKIFPMNFSSSMFTILQVFIWLIEYETYKLNELEDSINSLINQYKKVFTEYLEQRINENVAIIVSKNSKYARLFDTKYEYSIITADKKKMKIQNLDSEITRKIVILTEPDQIKFKKKISGEMIYFEEVFSEYWFPEKIFILYEIQNQIYNFYFRRRWISNFSINKKSDLGNSILNYFQEIYFLIHRWRFNKKFSKEGIEIIINRNSITIQQNLLNIDQNVFSNTLYWKEETIPFIYQYLISSVNMISSNRDFYEIIEKYIDIVFKYLLKQGIIKKKFDMKSYPEIINFLFPYKNICSYNIIQPVCIGLDLENIKKYRQAKEFFDLEKIDYMVAMGSPFYYTFFIEAKRSK